MGPSFGGRRGHIEFALIPHGDLAVKYKMSGLREGPEYWLSNSAGRTLNPVPQTPNGRVPNTTLRLLNISLTPPFNRSWHPVGDIPPVEV